jgi:hypothetical protein
MKLGGKGIRQKDRVDSTKSREVLLAVDLGLSTGIAVFDEKGDLCRARSHHLPDKSSFRRWVSAILREFPEIQYVIIEGGGDLAEIWKKALSKKNIRLKLINAGAWRQEFLLPREQRSGSQSKEVAIEMAKELIRNSPVKNKGPLRHDTAEAIMTGLYGVSFFKLTSES